MLLRTSSSVTSLCCDQEPCTSHHKWRSSEHRYMYSHQQVNSSAWQDHSWHGCGRNTGHFVDQQGCHVTHHPFLRWAWTGAWWESPKLRLRDAPITLSWRRERCCMEVSMRWLSSARSRTAEYSSPVPIYELEIIRLVKWIGPAITAANHALADITSAYVVGMLLFGP